MEDAFHWVRRRRIFNEKIPDKFIKAIDFASLRCSCEEAEARPIPALKDFAGGSVAVTEVVLAGDVTCILTDNGVAMALNGATLEKLCVLNSSPLFVVRSICYNSCNDTIIIICHSRALNHGLTISVLDRERVRNGNPLPVYKASKLQNLVIPYPGFVEFEEPNKRIVTSTPHDRLFCFWSMETYDIVFTMPNSDFKEIRISSGTVAFFKQPLNNCLPVKLCSIEDGTVLAERELPLLPQRDLRFLELCGSYLLLKQEGACICVHDLFEGKVFRMKDTKGFFPRAVTFFTADGQECRTSFRHAKNPTFFLAVHDTSMEICSCANGELVSVAKIAASPPEHPADCLQVVQSEDILLVYTNGQKTPEYCAYKASIADDNIQEEGVQPQSLFERWRRGEIHGDTEIVYDSPSFHHEGGEVCHDDQDAVSHFQEDENVFSMTPVPYTSNGAALLSDHINTALSEESLVGMGNGSPSVVFPDAQRTISGAINNMMNVTPREVVCLSDRGNVSRHCCSSVDSGTELASAHDPSSPSSRPAGLCNGNTGDQISDTGPGISVVDLRTGKQTGFVAMPCESAIYVLVYDPIRKEILAGGSKGLHRLKTSFDHAERDVKRRKVERTRTVDDPPIACNNGNMKNRRLWKDECCTQCATKLKLSDGWPSEKLPLMRPATYKKCSDSRAPASTLNILNDLGLALFRLLRWHYCKKKSSLHPELTMTPQLQHSGVKVEAHCSSPINGALTAATTVPTASLSPNPDDRLENCGDCGGSLSATPSSVSESPNSIIAPNNRNSQDSIPQASSFLNKQESGISREESVLRELKKLAVESKEHMAHASSLNAGRPEALEIMSLLRVASRCLCSVLKCETPDLLGLVVPELLLTYNDSTLDSQRACSFASQFLRCLQDNIACPLLEWCESGNPVTVEAAAQLTSSAILSAFRCLSCQSDIARPCE